ncbi:hypothetical protein A1Q1_06418 [Trichosporon asahii var. asahii CBS 2479]|uniref:Transcription factor Pcc1 n=1 Tax=Trichosporon asahii var. asahii (strain ATCC 90039 / CBS 2479 / JCM 2466 / KCTC 7840 / NBRC 103889/ NCYC 2677 / UAMH 7654) TaxID=1186058 RepID=J5SDZ1_TRIAS|nr:hypothetical protein A1Q1_06418 [Trichosporon asahii var. asahii CBS 2479]EJT45186.1 hypothetical protein A1Q1_06418 [Trichosporon asahii var. asahii CBS 2479]
MNAQHAAIAKRSLDVDREPNLELVERRTTVDGDVLIVTFRAASVRLLRLASNSFLSSVDLVLRTMAEFAPDPDEVLPTDEELEAIASRAREEGGGRKGIELKGGAGAGGGEEVK